MVLAISARAKHRITVPLIEETLAICLLTIIPRTGAPRFLHALLLPRTCLLWMLQTSIILIIESHQWLFHTRWWLRCQHKDFAHSFILVEQVILTCFLFHVQATLSGGSRATLPCELALKQRALVVTTGVLLGLPDAFQLLDVSKVRFFLLLVRIIVNLI